MEYEYLIQQGLAQAATIRNLLAAELGQHNYNRVCAAMAYVTIAGVRDVLGLLPAPASSQWVIGLDDAVTQPGAIDLCLSLDSSQVRVASLEDANRRFHSKVLYLSDTTHSFRSFLLLGSANLTKNALSGNAESIVVLRSDSRTDKRDLEELWMEAWELGRSLNEGELDEYKAKYAVSASLRNQARAARVRSQPKPAPIRSRLVLDDDRAEIDPATADICWIECGNVTAMGRELEFKAEQGLFFGLNPQGEEPKELQYRVSNGNSVQLRMKYQGNHMWRLQMTSAVPEVAKGLRPMRNGKLTRSPWVAVFERMPDGGTFRLWFVKLGSQEFLALRARSDRQGTIGRTTAREYGWY